MPAPQPSTQPDRAVLAGTVERVTFHNAESGFCVLRIKARAHRDLVTIVGHAATIAAGEWITASGEWINDTGPTCSPAEARADRPHRVVYLTTDAMPSSWRKKRLAYGGCQAPRRL